MATRTTVGYTFISCCRIGPIVSLNWYSVRNLHTFLSLCHSCLFVCVCLSLILLHTMRQSINTATLPIPSLSNDKHQRSRSHGSLFCIMVTLLFLAFFLSKKQTKRHMSKSQFHPHFTPQPSGRSSAQWLPQHPVLAATTRLPVLAHTALAHRHQ